MEPVIELSGVQFGLQSYAWFQIKQALSTNLIWNQKYDFRPKLHDMKFNYQFITSILKSPNLFARKENQNWKYFNILNFLCKLGMMCQKVRQRVKKSV